MSRDRLASTCRVYGQARVLKALGLPRLTFYQQRRRQLAPRVPAKRGPKTGYSDEQLLAEIRRSIQESPSHGEGHRKFCARLRLRQLRTSMRRVLRLIRENNLLALQRPQLIELKRDDCVILAEGPNRIWGIDRTASFTLHEGQQAILAMLHHATAQCLGLHVVRCGTGFGVSEPVRQAVREQFGGFQQGIASGLKLGRDYGSSFMRRDLQSEIRFLSRQFSPAFVCQSDGQRLRRALLPYPQRAAPPAARLRHPAGDRPSPMRIPLALPQGWVPGEAELSIPAARSSEAACHGRCRIAIIQKLSKEGQYKQSTGAGDD